MGLYRTISLILAIIFAVAGLIFLSIPGQVIAFFNGLSRDIGMPGADINNGGFYLALAAAYMYTVTVLAAMMYKNPRSAVFPVLLAHAKIASAVISLILFIFRGSYLIFITNCVVDGAIGIVVLLLYFKVVAANKTGTHSAVGNNAS